MTSPPKKLVVENISDRETACQITGTRESLRLLAQDLSKALDEVPEQKAVSYLQLPGWEQHTFESHLDGFYFRVEPDIESYIERQRASRGRLRPLDYRSLGPHSRGPRFDRHPDRLALDILIAATTSTGRNWNGIGNPSDAESP